MKQIMGERLQHDFAIEPLANLDHLRIVSNARRLQCPN
jgi:hypothetical protein